MILQLTESPTCLSWKKLVNSFVDIFGRRVAWITRDRYFSYLLILFFASFVLLPDSKSVNNVFYALVIPSVLCFIGSRKVWSGWVDPLFLGWCSLLVYLMAMGIWAGSWGYGKYVLYVFFFLMAVARLADASILARPLLHRLMFWTVAGYVVLSALVYWGAGQQPMGARIVDLPQRLSGPILTSMLLVCLYFLVVLDALRRQRWTEIVLGAGAVLFCSGYVLQSRSGLVGLVLLCLLYLIRGVCRGSWARSAGIGGILVLAGAAAYGLLNDNDVVRSLFARADAKRFELWQVLFETWGRCGWFWGCGVEYKDGFVIADGILIQHPHNIFMGFGFYNGIPAMLGFIALMVVTLRRAWLHGNPWGGYLFLALVMLNLDGHQLIDSPNELWLLVLLPAFLILNSKPAHDQHALMR